MSKLEPQWETAHYNIIKHDVIRHETPETDDLSNERAANSASRSELLRLLEMMFTGIMIPISVLSNTHRRRSLALADQKHNHITTTWFTANFVTRTYRQYSTVHA